MKILVVLHIFYQEQADYFAAQFANLDDIDCDFIITTSDENLKLQKKFARFNPTILKVFNRGLDVGPFFYALENTDISKYDFIIKLHAKRISLRGYKKNQNGWFASGEWWRNLLVESLIGRPEIIKDNLKKFADNPDVNMLASPYFIIKVKPTEKNLAKHLKISKDFKLSPKLELGNLYVEGTMFMARTKIFPPLLSKIHFSDFKKSDVYDKHSDELPYFMERYFGTIGTKIMSGASNKRFEKMSNFFGIKRLFFISFQTNSGKHIIRILGVPIWWKKIKAKIL